MARRPIDFARLRGLVHPYRALRLMDWQPTWTRGVLLRGRCPWQGCGQGSRSFSLTDLVAYCHICHWMGDALAIWAKHTGLPLPDAAADLCQRLNLSPPLL